MRRYGKAFTLSVLLMFMVALVGTSKPEDAATPYNNIAQTKLLYEENDIRKDADGRYYNTYIAHDGMKLAADGNRHVCEMSAEGYKKTRIERGELYFGTRDGVVYYLRMNTTEAGYTLDSQVSTVYELVELNINTGAEQVVYSKKTDSTVRTKAVGYLTRRQGDVIYILEKLKQEPASDDSSYKLYFDIDTYDLTTGKLDTYGSYTLDIDKKTASQNIITMICGFFIPGEGKVGLFWHKVKSEIKSDTVSYGAIGEDFSSIRLYDKSSSLITSYELAGSTFFNGVRISDYDVSTGNLFFTAVGMYSGFCLMVANITGNTIRMAPSITDKTGLKRERSIAGGYAGSGFGEMGLIGGRYLAVLNSEWRFSDGESDATVHILDASKISYDKVDLVNEQSQELSSDGPEPDIYRINHPRKAQSIRLSNRLDATLFAMKVRYGELDMTRKMDLASDVFVSRESHDVHDVSGVGVRAAYNKARDSIIFNTGEKELTEVSVKDKKVIAKYQTAHPVWCTLISGNTLVVMEREGSKGNTWVGSIDRNARNVAQNVAERFYFESIDMTLSQTTGIEVPATTISVGASLDLKATYPTAAKSAVNFSSSDESVFSVTSDGKGAAWRAGSATVTATREDGGTAGVVTIKVSPKSSVAASATEIDTDLNYYSVYALKNDIYGHICTEWIEELSDGTIMRVGCKLVKRSREDDDGSVISSMIPESVCASFYSADGKPLDEKVIPLELTKFGGFYHGKDAYYLVFGGDNYDETTGVKEKEVVRIVKYDSSWKRLGACSFYGKETNTISTFIAGTVRMDETADGVLYIHTAKQIYKDKKGLNHQMNMLLAVDEKTMTGISTPEVSA